MSSQESSVFVPEHKSQLQKIIKSNRIVVLKLGAEWCRPCVACAPHYAAMSKRHPDVVNYSKDIRKDIKRRDFTMNALAFNPLTSELLDEYEGLEDIKNRDPVKYILAIPTTFCSCCKNIGTINIAALGKSNNLLHLILI